MIRGRRLEPARTRAAGRPRLRLGALALAGVLVPLGSASAQVADPVPLFASADPIAVTLIADLDALDGDRRSSPDRPGTLTVRGDSGDEVDVPIELRTRGQFRLDPANCSFPPLRLDIDGDAAQGTPFASQDHLKLVSSCRPGRASYDELIIEEYLVYRTALLLTAQSFQVRLLTVTFADSRGTREPETRPAFVIEEDDALAERLGATVFDLEEGKKLPIGAFEPVSAMRTGVLEYMVGNTDWGIEAGHNVEILDRGGVAIAVPYDFDIAGVVDAPYATTNPDYHLSSVRERYYRGWCANPFTTHSVLEEYRSAKEPILALWRSEERLSEDVRNRIAGYLEEFYSDIETDERAERRFLRDCRVGRSP